MCLLSCALSRCFRLRKALSPQFSGEICIHVFWTLWSPFHVLPTNQTSSLYCKRVLDATNKMKKMKGNTLFLLSYNLTKCLCCFSSVYHETIELCWESVRACFPNIINMILTERETIFIGNVWDGNLGSAINFLACSLSVSNFNILIRLRGSGVWAHVTEYNLDVYPLGGLAGESEKKIRAKNSRSISVTSCSSATN